MKTKEELLKIYSAYFPYELKVKHSDYEREIDSICDIVSLCKEEIEIMNSEHGYVCDFGYIKPVLYSMDMLTKEIEHKGEKFIPTVWLRDNHAQFGISKEDMKTLISMFLHVFNSPFSAPHYFIDKLLEWHFNVFGLEENDFIKKKRIP